MSIADDLVAAHAPFWTQALEDYLRAIGAMYEELELYIVDDDDDFTPTPLLIRENACPNPSFEYDSAGQPPAMWGVSGTLITGGTMSILTDTFRIVGNHSCTIQGTGSSGGAQLTAAHIPAPAAAGQVWSASAQVYNATACHSVVQLAFWDVDNNMISSALSGVMPAGAGGGLVTPVRVAPVGTAFVSARIIVTRDTTGIVNATFDAIGLIEGPPPPTVNHYGDGDTPGWEWLGAPGQSASQISLNVPRAGWSSMLDVERAPVQALPYLAQWVGERLPLGITEADARMWIRRTPNQDRGTLPAIVHGVQRWLTGSRTVFTKERAKIDGTISSDWLALLTYGHETPNTAWVLDELRRLAPIDINIDYATQVADTWGTVKATYATWGDVKSSVPNWGALNVDVLGRVPLGFTLWTP